MEHRKEIDTIIEQVAPWPMEERVALTYQILRDMRKQARRPVPRQTLVHAVGIASSASPPPDDAKVRVWIEEHRLQKHG